jgi:hypothetical protein
VRQRRRAAARAGEARRRELAVRVALGAGTKRLARLLVTESALLAAFGGAMGWRSLDHRAAASSNAPADCPRLTETSIDWVVLSSRSSSRRDALLTGVLPLAHATQLALSGELREGGRGSTTAARGCGGAKRSSPSKSRWPCARRRRGLMIRTVRNLLNVDPGFRSEGVLTMRISTPSVFYPDSVRVAAFWDDLQRASGVVARREARRARATSSARDEMGDWGSRSKATRRRRTRARRAIGRS